MTSSARVVSRTALRYTAGADVDTDRGEHVRAGSGCAFIDVPGRGRRLAVVQDDAAFIALVDPSSGDVDVVTLPAGAGGVRRFDKGRGNKMDKLDLESIVAIDLDGTPTLLCVGSGSAPIRECVVLVRFVGVDEVRVEHIALPAFYAALRARRDFAGDELNIEGAVVVGDRLLLFNRGNGAGTAVDAVATIALADLLAPTTPAIVDVTAVDLGRIAGTRLTFTDATVHPDGRVFWIAAAEASPNAIDDGVVVGTAVGVYESGNVTTMPLLDEHGAPLLDKVEGIAFDHDGTCFVVVDKDDPEQPADLLVVELPHPR